MLSDGHCRTYANPRQSVSSNLIKLSTYHSWFMTGDIPQEELRGWLSSGYAKVYQAHIRYPFCLCDTFNAVSYWCTPSCYWKWEVGSSQTARRQHRVCSKCSRTVVEDEVHFFFGCPAYDRIREKYNAVLFAQFGGCQEASSTMKHNADNVRLFMDQEPSFQSLFMNAWNFGGRRNVRTTRLPYYQLAQKGIPLEPMKAHRAKNTNI